MHPSERMDHNHRRQEEKNITATTAAVVAEVDVESPDAIVQVDDTKIQDKLPVSTTSRARPHHNYHNDDTAPVAATKSKNQNAKRRNSFSTFHQQQNEPLLQSSADDMNNSKNKVVVPADKELQSSPSCSINRHDNRQFSPHDHNKRTSPSLFVMTDQSPPPPSPQDRQEDPLAPSLNYSSSTTLPPSHHRRRPIRRQEGHASPLTARTNPNHPTRQTFLTSVDLDTIEKLDADYERALLQREIGWNARYMSVRQNAGLSLWFFFVFLMCGTIFFEINTEWTLGESLLFSIYTITTVGYGNHVIPNKPSVLIFICFYIFIGIALLTILAAQLYQWITLELTWVQYKRDSSNFLKRHRQNVQNSQYLEATMVGELPIRVKGEEEEEGGLEAAECSCQDKVFELGLKLLNWIQAYIKDNPLGQLMVVLVPFFVLILLGAAVVGTIQGWDVHESIYFAVVSMTTVGFGDYYPSELASTWFCIFWLPFSVGFLSLYLGSVAQLYLHISKQNVKRVESNLRNRINKVKLAEEQERAEAIARMHSGGFDLGAMRDKEGGEGGIHHKNHAQDIPEHLNKNKKYNEHNGFLLLPESPSVVEQNYGEDNSSLRQRRDNILYNSKSCITNEEEISGETMKSMKHVIAAVKQNMKSPRRMQEESEKLDPNQFGDVVPANPHLSLKSTRHYKTAQGIEKKPSFALRVLVQERFSKIIANEIAGYQSQVEIKNNTLSVTIDSLKQTADKWVIPRRARKAFRAVAFEVLYFVGERALIVNGADAVLELRPNEVQSLFAPLLAAFGDADTMEAWLARTQIMAEYELHETCQDEKRQIFDRIMKNREEKITDNMTANPSMKRNVIGNAVRNQM